MGERERAGGVSKYGSLGTALALQNETKQKTLFLSHPLIPHGIRSNGAVSPKHLSKTASTALRATPGPPQCGFMATLRAARRRAHAWAPARRAQLPRAASWRKVQSPDRVAARISEQAWCSQADQSRVAARQWSYACTSSWTRAWLTSPWRRKEEEKKKKVGEVGKMGSGLT